MNNDKDLGNNSEESQYHISLAKWTVIYCLANVLGMLAWLAILNLGMLIGELIIYPSTQIFDGELENPALTLFYLSTVVFAFFALTLLTYWLPLRCFDKWAEINRICLRVVLLQSLLGCYFPSGYVTGFIDYNEFGYSVILMSSSISILSGILQGMLLFRYSWESILKWLTISLMFSLSQISDLVSFTAAYLVSYGLILDWPVNGASAGNGLELVEALLALLLLYLIPGLIISLVTGLISGLIIRPFFLDELLPNFKKQ